MNNFQDHYHGDHAAIYDASVGEDFQGDVQFYVSEALRSGGPALELACGSGRITIPIAKAGVEITGLDLSEAMLARAQEKAGKLEPEVEKRITLRSGDMRNFDLGRQFPLIIIPFRAFLCLMTLEDQKRALVQVHRHLQPDGRLIFNVFDPDLRVLVEHSGSLGQAAKFTKEFIHPVTGARTLEWRTTRFNLEEQSLEELCVYEQVDDKGICGKSEVFTLRLRYIFRYEMEHLLEICGFRVEALYGDFNRGPFKAGGEQIWVATRDGGQ
jgi:ubiquinone/menaquinone biosynthesis C-methylase UbiE